MLIVKIPINDVYYSLTLAKKFSKKELWSKKNDKFYRWGAGLLNTGRIPYKAELVGILGEMAFSKISGLPMDSKYKKRGNTHDFRTKIKPTLRNVNIEVKTRLKDFGDVYVKRYDENGNIISLKSDIYVFCHLKTPWNKIENHIINQEKMKPIIVSVDGVISKKRLKTKPIQDAFNGNHKNIVFPIEGLANIQELINLIE